VFVPKSVVCFRQGYTREALTRDIIAGVVVGIVALPLALAFAIASGVPPERGLYTDIFVLIVTFALTVFVDLSVAVQAGVVASSLLFMRRRARSRISRG
jgi:MFS superfamily sulfate permease-like transporter